MSQDEYGSNIELTFKDDVLPIPDIAVGRLVEEPTDIMAVIDAYLSLEQETQPYTVVLDSNSLALSVGYDFMTDTANAISDVMTGAGDYGQSTGLQVTELISDDWTASQLVDLLNDVNNDPQIAFLAGHYAANAGVAADYETFFYPEDILTSPQDFTNDIFFSNGCHSGYNIVNEHSEIWTLEPDWAQAFASRGATLIAGTGYQYGDTDFIEYNERLYLEFSIALRNGQSGGAISIGDALVQAKQAYLKDTPIMRGIHQKSLLQSTIFGLPMLRVDMPGDPIPEVIKPSVVDNAVPISGNPGDDFNLHTFDLTREYDNTANCADCVGTLNEVNVTLQDVDGGPAILASYLEGPLDKIVRNVGEPILPLDEINVTEANNLVLRGVGFRGGEYHDYQRTKYVLIGSATTEVSAAHFNFLSPIFFPPIPWSINRYDALTNENGSTLLNVTPAQYQADIPAPEATILRQYDQMQFRLFYSDFTAQTGPNLPALAMAPALVSVKGDDDAATNSVTFDVQVVGDPSAGIQEVWITYTSVNAPTVGGTYGKWSSKNLTQDPGNSTMWTDIFSMADLDVPPGTEPHNLRFIAQACTGTGLCSMSDNFGRYYIPGADDEGLETVVTQPSGPNNGEYGTEVTFSATLEDANGEPLKDLPLFIALGQKSGFGITDSNGFAEVNIPLLAKPGDYKVNAWFPGNVTYSPGASQTSLDFTIDKRKTSLILNPAEVFIGSIDPDVEMVAELREGIDGTGDPLPEKTVVFTLQGANSTIKKAVITNQQGQARLGKVILPELTTYTVEVEFGGTGSYEPSSTLPSAGRLETLSVYANTKGSTWEETIWPTNNKMLDIEIRRGNGDPLGYPYRYLRIEQDEATSGEPDATISADCSAASVRAERDGNGNGRVYHILFEYEPAVDMIVNGEAFLGTIPHDQSGDVSSINDGPPYDVSATCSS